LGTSYSIDTLVYMAPNEVETLAFRPWQPSGPGGWTFQCNTALAGDSIPEDDTCRFQTVAFITHDAAVLRILDPRYTVDSGVTRTPKAAVRNFGARSHTIPVILSVSDGYIDTVLVYLRSGESTQVSFDTWQATRVGTFDVRCSTALAGDEYQGNNWQRDTVHVRARPAALEQDTPVLVAKAPLVWPSTARNLLNLDWSEDLALLSADGRECLMLRPGPNCTNQLPAGVYFVHTGAHGMTLKVVIQR